MIIPTEPKQLQSSVLIVRRLYRALLRAVKPYTPPSPDAVVLTCLLHRTGYGDDRWKDFVKRIHSGGAVTGNLGSRFSANISKATVPSTVSVETDDSSTMETKPDGIEEAAEDWTSDSEVELETDDDDADEDDEYDIEDDMEPHRLLFSRLLREVFTDSPSGGSRTMQFPQQVQPSRLRDIIRREFRDNRDATESMAYDSGVRRETAFMALRELNKKLVWADRMRHKSPPPHPNQAARWVSSLPLSPSAYLRPGAYLLAHPLMEGFFRRAVILILDHREEGQHATDDDSSSSRSYGTYGLVVNRLCSSQRSGKNMTLEEIIRPLPSEISVPFGESLVKDGGPVNLSVQMLYATPNDQDTNEADLRLGGIVLPMISDHVQHISGLKPHPDRKDNALGSVALHSGRAIYYRGDIIRAAQAVLSGQLDREDVTFFVGASCWSVGQLESEVQSGCWLPCSGPPDIAHSGMCEYNPLPPLPSGTKGLPHRPKADLWLSMLSACGNDESKLAHLVWNDEGQDEYSSACDDDT